MIYEMEFQRKCPAICYRNHTHDYYKNKTLYGPARIALRHEVKLGRDLSGINVKQYANNGRNNDRDIYVGRS